MAIAGTALLAWDWGRGRAPWRTWPGLRGLVPGLYGIFGYHALLVLALDLAPPVQANVLNYTWPLWILVLGARASGGRLPARVMLGGLIGLGGAVLALEPWSPAGAAQAVADAVGSGGDAGGGIPPAQARAAAGHAVLLGHPAILGYGMALGAGFCWGSFTVWLRRFPGPEAPPLGWWCLLAGSVAALWTAASGVPLLPERESWPALLYIGLVPLGAAFPLWAYAARHAALPVLGLLSYLTPPLSTLLLGWAAGRAPSPWAWAGLAVVLGGAALGGGRMRPAQRR
jgi:drug/metabolite transporter (DMT)-like permease